MKIFFSLLTMMVLSGFNVHAVVDMNNANYSQSWTDIEVPGSGYDLKVVRTYNSRSLFNGMFGYGWCSDFETNVAITPEGNVKLTECGSGQEILFFPREYSRKEIDKTVAQIVSRMRADKKIDENTIKKLSTSLLTDNNLRAKYAYQYKISVAVKEGSQFFVNGKEVESITFAKSVYTRTFPDGSFQRFNLQGKLSYLYDKNSNFLKFDYDKDGTLKQIVDNNGRQLSFKYYPNKKVKQIGAPGNLVAEYKFKDLDDLVYAKNGWKNEYTYEYDQIHNMTKAVFPDKTFIALTFEKTRDWVTSFTDREKCVEKYDYEFDQQKPEMHYWSNVTKTCGKEVTNQSKHEFWYAKRADGEVYLQRVASTINGNIIDISYHEVFGKPVSIFRNKVRATFDYYPNGLVKTKKNDYMKMSYDYDKASQKVSSVTIENYGPKGKVLATKKSDFRYDAKGNLIFAQNSDGQKVNLAYDNKGRIESIVDQAKKVVKIEYDEKFGKPALVTRPGMGSIQVSYKATGEIDKTVSKDGPTVALQVASTFNNLLDVIAPASAEIYN